MLFDRCFLIDAFFVTVPIVRESVNEDEGIVTVIEETETGVVGTEIATAAVHADAAVVAEGDRSPLGVQRHCLICQHV